MNRIGEWCKQISESQRCKPIPPYSLKVIHSSAFLFIDPFPYLYGHFLLTRLARFLSPSLAGTILLPRSGSFGDCNYWLVYSVNGYFLMLVGLAVAWNVLSIGFDWGPETGLQRRINVQCVFAQCLLQLVRSINLYGCIDNAQFQEIDRNTSPDINR